MVVVTPLADFPLSKEQVGRTDSQCVGNTTRSVPFSSGTMGAWEDCESQPKVNTSSLRVIKEEDSQQGNCPRHVHEAKKYRHGPKDVAAWEKWPDRQKFDDLKPKRRAGFSTNEKAHWYWDYSQGKWATWYDSWQADRSQSWDYGWSRDSYNDWRGGGGGTHMTQKTAPSAHSVTGRENRTFDKKDEWGHNGQSQTKWWDSNPAKSKGRCHPPQHLDLKDDKSSVIQRSQCELSEASGNGWDRSWADGGKGQKEGRTIYYDDGC